MAADFEAEIWPDNEAAVRVFVDMGTQWRVGFSGPYGLDFNVLPMMFDAHEVPKSDRADLIADLRVMESSALGEMQKS